MFPKPLFNDFPLRSENHTLPFNRSIAFVILAHNVGAFVEDVYQTVTGPLEVVGGKSGFMFLHTTVGYQGQACFTKTGLECYSAR